MSNRRWSKFWWQDYERDAALRMCGFAAQGLWMRLLCFMHEGEPYGHLTVNGKPPSMKQLASIVGGPEKEVVKLVEELRENGVLSISEVGAMYCRRMERDKVASDEGREFGKSGGNPALREKQQKDEPHGGKPGPATPPLNGIHQRGGLTPPLTSRVQKQKQSTESRGSLTLTSAQGARESEFAAFWSVYPRRVGKDRARAAFDAACKRGADPGEIVLAARQQRWNPNPRYIPHPTSWLNAGSWQDDMDAAAPIEPEDSHHRLSVCNAMIDMGNRQ